VLAGVVGATVDIACAILFFGWTGVPAERILQSVASGLLGTAAFQGGWPPARWCTWSAWDCRSR
jgi:hypothetical protein